MYYVCTATIFFIVLLLCFSKNYNRKRFFYLKVLDIFYIECSFFFVFIWWCYREIIIKRKKFVLCSLSPFLPSLKYATLASCNKCNKPSKEKDPPLIKYVPSPEEISWSIEEFKLRAIKNPFYIEVTIFLKKKIAVQC